MIRNDLTPGPGMRNIRSVADDLQSGYGRLFLGTTRRTDDFGVYYSPRSNHLNWLDKINGHDENWLRAVEQLHRYPRYIAYAEVEMGYLRETPPKVLFLPHVRSLSDREINELKDYVRAGGVLLAGTNPGLQNKHGILRKAWPLAEVFGLKRVPVLNTGTGKGKSVPVKITEVIEKLDFRDLKMSINKDLVGSGVKPNGARPLFLIGDKAAGFVNAYGKGLALYLNLDAMDLKMAGLDPKKDPGALLRIIGERLFAARNLRRGYEIRWAHGNPTFKVKRSTFLQQGAVVAEFIDSQARYLVFLRQGKGELAKQPLEKATLTLDKPAHVYEPRSGRYAGYVKELSLQFKRSVPHIVSLLPYAVKTVGIKVPGSAKPGANVTIVAAILAGKNTPAGRHVFALRVYQPDGTEARWFRKNYDTPHGRLKTTIQMALNAAPGKWSVTVRDVATGIQGKVEFQMQEK
ncbi:MAG: hypothetical protein MJH11_21175 [Lentisphaeria bacterium]|nr:hypothetical protein [Lentisphaeria bacterium]